MQLNMVIDGIPRSKREIFERVLLCGEKISFDPNQRDDVSRTLLFLDDGNLVREPLVVQAIRNVLKT